MFWWPKMDAKICEFIGNCQICAKYRNRQPNSFLRSWKETENPFDRIHVDVAEYKTKRIIVMVDAYSGWVDCKLLTDLSANTTIECLSNSFKYMGYPRQLVSDNGTNFTSIEVEKFCRANNIQHIFTPPYHHQSNGVAERQIETLKCYMRKCESDITSWVRILREYCILQNSTPNCAGKTPNKEIFNYRVRTRMDSFCSEELEQIPSQPVLMRTNGNTWEFGEVKPTQSEATGALIKGSKNKVIHKSQYKTGIKGSGKTTAEAHAKLEESGSDSIEDESEEEAENREASNTGEPINGDSMIRGGIGERIRKPVDRYGFSV
jgi:hypothetical protein